MVKPRLAPRGMLIAPFLLGALALAALLAVPLPAMASPESTWRAVEIVSAGHLQVRVEHLPSASMADETWIRWVFENTGELPIEIRSAQYRIEGVRQVQGAEAGAISGGLASGNTFDLFAEAWKTTPVADRFVRPGSHIVAGQPSRYGAALLGLPPRAGFAVSARVHLSLVLADDEQLDTPPAGIPMTFAWRPPTPEGLRAMGARLGRLLARPELTTRPCDAYLLDALLGVPEVRGGVSLGVLTRAMEGRSGGFSGRSALARRLHELGVSHEELASYFLARLQRADPTTLSDLHYAPSSFWDPAWLEPLVAMHEASGGTRVLRLLHRHREAWIKRTDVAERLLAASLKAHASTLDAAAVGTGGAARWGEAAREISLSGSAKALGILAPWLEDHTLRHAPGARVYGMLPGSPPVAGRTRDVALEGMLRLHFGSVIGGYQALLSDEGLAILMDSRDGAEPGVLAVRDAAIAALRALLK